MSLNAKCVIGQVVCLVLSGTGCLFSELARSGAAPWQWAVFGMCIGLIYLQILKWKFEA